MSEYQRTSSVLVPVQHTGRDLRLIPPYRVPPVWDPRPFPPFLVETEPQKV